MNNNKTSSLCSHSLIVTRTDSSGTTWHCASCLRTFFPSGDTRIEQTIIRLRTALSGLTTEVRGVMSYAEADLRMAIGNTNFSMLMTKVLVAMEALSGDSAAPQTASGYQTYPGEPITGIYEAGIGIVRLGDDGELGPGGD